MEPRLGVGGGVPLAEGVSLGVAPWDSVALPVVLSVALTLPLPLHGRRRLGVPVTVDDDEGRLYS